MQRRACWRRGSTAVEFSLTLPFLVVLALGVIDLGRFMTERQRFVQATYETTRYAAVGDLHATDAQVEERAVYTLEEAGLDPTGLAVVVRRYADAGDDVVTVELTLPVRVLGGMIALPTTHTQSFTMVEREVEHA